MLCQLPQSDDPNLLSRDIPCADAGIYRISDSQALLQSVDFFTPVVDTPRLFGEIAAANALSDIYAMGGRPLTALNLVGFPSCLELEILTEIMQGGAAKVMEAGAVIVGGHSVEDEEPKYGLSVTGIVDPRHMITTVGCRAGDRLILTKPLGTGLLTTALKGEILEESDFTEAISGMATLNRVASEIMMEVGISACTDITGFGLLGHALEMAEASRISLLIEGDALPAYPKALDMAEMGLVPQGSYRNRQHYLERVLEAERIPRLTLDLLADPQTSGGLFIAVDPSKADELCSRLTAAKRGAYPIGWVSDGPAGTLQVI